MDMKKQAPSEPGACFKEWIKSLFPAEELSGITFRVALEEVCVGVDCLAVKHIGVGQDGSEATDRIHRL